MTFEEWLESQLESDVGRVYLRCRERLYTHYYPLKRRALFPGVDYPSTTQTDAIEQAVEKQLVLSHNVLQWMVWRLTPEAIRSEAKLPLTQKAFTKFIGVSESQPRQWRKTYTWMDNWLFMTAKTGKDILKAVEDDFLTEIGEQALDRFNENQLGWMKVAVEVTGLKAPTVTKNYEVNVDELTDDELDALAAGEDPKKVLS